MCRRADDATGQRASVRLLAVNVPIPLGAALIDVTYDKQCPFCDASVAREIVFAFEVNDDMALANWVECRECEGRSWLT